MEWCEGWRKVGGVGEKRRGRQQEGKSASGAYLLTFHNASTRKVFPEKKITCIADRRRIMRGPKASF